MHTSTPHVSSPTVLILQSCLSFLIQNQCLKRFLNVFPPANILFNPLCYFPLPLPFHPSLFSSFQYISLCRLAAQMNFDSIDYHSLLCFLAVTQQVPSVSCSHHEAQPLHRPKKPPTGQRPWAEVSETELKSTFPLKRYLLQCRRTKTG
jgi:hypothetical protein